jgi:hypothetical protein
LKALEDAKAATGLTNPLDAGVRVVLPAQALHVVAPYVPELADLCGVSRFTVTAGAAESIAIDDLRRQRDADALGLA